MSIEIVEKKSSFNTDNVSVFFQILLLPFTLFILYGTGIVSCNISIISNSFNSFCEKYDYSGNEIILNIVWVFSVVGIIPLSLSFYKSNIKKWFGFLLWGVILLISIAYVWAILETEFVTDLIDGKYTFTTMGNYLPMTLYVFSNFLSFLVIGYFLLYFRKNHTSGSNYTLYRLIIVNTVVFLVYVLKIVLDYIEFVQEA